MVVKPEILQPGDTVGVVTLGSPVLDPDSINENIQVLENMGLNVVLGRHVYDFDGYLAGSDEERAADLMAMFADEDVKMILPARGGVGISGILPYLDFRFITEHPKIISGYSDVTVLLNALYQFANLGTFHSLMLLDFRPTTPAYNFEQFFTVTSTPLPEHVIENPPGMPLVDRVPGEVTGPIVGGNITSLLGTLGTPFEIDTRGRILFLEEVNEPINTVYRYVKHLEMAGKFEDCIGIILGECSGCQPAYGETYEDLINNFFIPLGKPLVSGLASGHGRYKAAIPIGANTHLNANEASIRITEPMVRF